MTNLEVMEDLRSHMHNVILGESEHANLYILEVVSIFDNGLRRAIKACGLLRSFFEGFSMKASIISISIWWVGFMFC